jgi:hypothetical protein
VKLNTVVHVQCELRLLYNTVHAPTGQHILLWYKQSEETGMPIHQKGARKAFTIADSEAEQAAMIRIPSKS